MARGFIHEAFALLVWVLGIAAGFAFADRFSVVVERVTNWHQFSYLIAFIAIFVLVWVLGLIFTGLFRTVLQHVGLGPLDRLMGFLFGLVRAAVVVIVALMLLMAISPQSTGLSRSQLAPHFKPWVKRLKQWAPDVSQQINKLRG